MRFFIRSQLGEFLALFLPFLAIICATAFSLVYFDDEKRLSIAKESAVGDVDRHRHEISAKLENIYADLRILATQNELSDHLNAVPGNAIELMSQEYLSFARYKGIYDQIRFIDQLGNEIIRVNYNNGSPELVPAHKLQNKSQRYYFKETYNQKPGNVFVSPFDLNVEQGQIESPIKPMIRFGMPATDLDGEKKGIVLLNYLGDDLLNIFNSSSETTLGQSFLINQDGYFLSGPDAGNNWGFMYPEKQEITFNNLYGEIASVVTADESGQFLTSEGLYTFTTIYPLVNITDSESSGSERMSASPFYWKAVSFIPANSNYLTSLVFKLSILALTIFLSLIGGIGCWLLARSKSHLRETAKQLAQKLDELEQTRNEMIQSEKLASIGRMVAGFAHEINTPIGIAVGASSLTQESYIDMKKQLEYHKLSENNFKELLSVISESTDLALRNLQRASTLVQSFKRTSADQATELARPFLVNDVVSDILLNLNNIIKNTQIDIQISCPSGLLIYSVPGMLDQILTNLIQNSVNHAFKYDDIESDTTSKNSTNETIEIRFELIESQLHLNYSDNGKGMSEETLKQIFEPFFTTNRSGGGTGLGLYVVHKIITEQLQGSISCYSDIGEGFRISLDYPVEKLSEMTQPVVNETRPLSH